MSKTQFNSTSFFLSKWAEDAPSKQKPRRRIELDIVEDPSVREVCKGSNCGLYYDTQQEEYVNTGNCARGTLCTETRIVKDGLFRSSGSVSATNRCVNYSVQLCNW